MDWSNERILEFIELLEEEPSIWNPKSNSHKNRNLVNDAWIRITNKLSVHCSIEELKKKRNTLMTQYRECIKKIKESTKTGSGVEEIYRPSWFAFDAIHNFMGGVYDYRPSISQESTDKSPLLLEAYSVDQHLENPLSHESYIERPVSRESNSQGELDSYFVSKRKRGVKDLISAKKQMDEAFSFVINRCKENDEPDECDLYGQLLAQKLKTLSVDDRLVLMNDIDNIVFKYIMEVFAMFLEHFTFILLVYSQIVVSQDNQKDRNVEMEVRAVFMNCAVNENDNNFPPSENMRYAQEELFRHGSLTNCKKKLALTIKMSGDIDGKFGDEYIPIDHVISGPSKIRTRLLNPYVLRLRREPPLQAYELRRIDTVRGVLTNNDYQQEDSSNIKRQTTLFHKKANMIRYQNDNQGSIENEDDIVQEIKKINNNVPKETTIHFSNGTYKDRFKRAEDGNGEQNQYDYRSESWITDSLIADINNFQQPVYENKNKHCGKMHDHSYSDAHKIKRGHRFKSPNHRNSDNESQRSKHLLLLGNKLNTELNSKYDDRVSNNFTTLSSEFDNEGSITEKWEPTLGNIDTTEKAYELYEIGNPDLWSTVNVQLFEKLIAPNGQIVWNDITKGESASVSSSLPDWGNQDMNIRYQNTEWVARDDFVLPKTDLCLLTPLKERDWDDSIDNLRSINAQDYFVLPMDAVINLDDSNNIIKRYSNDSDFSLSTETTSNYQFHRRVQIRLSRALYSSINNTMGIASRGNDRFLTLPYQRTCRGQIDLEARADDNELVTIGSSGCLTTAVSDSTRPTSTTLTIQATNNGLAAARFRAVVRECHPTLTNGNKNTKELVTNRVLIPPKHTRSLQLQVLNDIPVNTFHCSVGLLNDYDVQVAVRDVTIKKGDRCFCVWHCDCVCLSEDPKLLCREMSLSHQIAAGLSSQNRRRHARSVCYNDIVTIDMFVTILGVTCALLLLGLLKAFIGLFNPTVRNCGLDRVLQTPRKLERYYECLLRSRRVVYDDDGWPVHPDTKQRTVHLVSRPMGFILNIIFFIVIPCLTVRNLFKTVKTRCICTDKSKAVKTCCPNKEAKKCFSSQDLQSVEPRWRRRRGGLRRWMTPQAEELSTDIWQKALPSQRSMKCEFMRPLLHEHRYHENNSVEYPDSCVDSEQEDTKYVLMQMQKSRESLRRSQQKINDSEGFLTRNDSKSKDIIPNDRNN